MTNKEIMAIAMRQSAIDINAAAADFLNDKNVLPEYRRQGVASSLTSNLAVEILDRGKVPFYCCAWSNIKSVKNAIRSGLMPAWVEMTVKPASVVENMNQ